MRGFGNIAAALAFVAALALPAAALAQGSPIMGADLVAGGSSSTTALGAGAAFTGSSFIVQGYSTIVVTVKTDQASAANGLVIEQSQDNTNWDISDSISVSANTATELVVAVRAVYARTKYTNGGTLQGSFRLQTTKHVMDTVLPRALSANGNLKVELPTGASATEVQGDVAHDAADSGKPVKVGGKATAAAPANVTEGDRVNASYTLAGSARILDDNSAAVKAAVETIDNMISGSRGLVTEDNSAAIKTAVEVIDNFISGARGLVTEDNSAAIKTAVETIDNLVHAGNDAAYSSNVPIGAILDDTATTAVTEGQVAPLRLTPQRGVHVQLRSGTAEVGTSGAPLRVDPTGTTAQPVTDNGGNLSVDWAGTAPPIGAGLEATALRVTVATDSTGVLAVKQATAANLNMTEASAAAIKTAVEIVDDWDEADRAKVNLIVGQAGIAGGTGLDGVTVPRVTLATNVALPAGTNAIGKLAANSGVDIGDVDVLSVVPGTGVTNLGKAEDQASADADVGVALMAVRKATPANTSGLDGDYEALQISAGRLWASATIDAAIPAGSNTIGTVNVGTFPDNEPINVAQMNGVAVSMGSGANGTGVQRVTIATDQGAITTQLPATLVGGRLDANAGAWLGSTAPTVGQKAMASSIPVVVASDQAPVTTLTRGSANIANGQVALSTTSAQAVAARTTRRAVTIRNLDSTISVYVGTGTVSSANGMLLKAGDSIEINTSAAVNAIAASGTPSVAYLEEYD